MAYANAYRNLDENEWEKVKTKHLTINQVDDDEYQSILDKFKSNPDMCGRDHMNEIMNHNCRNFQASVHISMLVLASTMVKDGKTSGDTTDEGQYYRYSNMRVNHNNPSKTAAMEMMNNMALNPLGLETKNVNDRMSWGRDMEVYMTKWDNKTEVSIIIYLW